MSFDCPHCGLHNTELQSAGEIQQHGSKHMLRIDKIEDLQREVLKGEHATFRIDNLDVEAPPGPGRISNVEGFLSKIREDLEKDQDARKEQAPEQYEIIGRIMTRLEKMLEGQDFPIVIVVDDPSGNSKIQPSPLDGTGKYKATDYKRTPEQNAMLGLAPNDAEPEATDLAPEDEDTDIVEGKAYTLPTDCPGCTRPAAVNMTMISIPYFKQVVVSAVSCQHCGYKSNEVRTGGEVPELGKRITLKVKNAEDMKRDILKSESCLLKVPECSLELVPGTMGGRFTTVEGLLTQVRNDLHSSIFDVDYGRETSGDSMEGDQKAAWNTFFKQLDLAIQAEFEYTIVLEDPLAGSYVQSYTAPDPDPQIQTEDYQRTEDEEEELGLTDMRTKQNDKGEYVREQIGDLQTTEPS